MAALSGNALLELNSRFDEIAGLSKRREKLKQGPVALRRRDVYTGYTFDSKEISMLTRVFRSGNSMAVRIPKELAFSDNIQEVEIEQIGNTLVVRPVEAQTLADLMDICAMFTPDFLAEGRDESPDVERDWEAFGGPTGGEAATDS